MWKTNFWLFSKQFRYKRYTSMYNSLIRKCNRKYNSNTLHQRTEQSSQVLIHAAQVGTYSGMWKSHHLTRGQRGRRGWPEIEHGERHFPLSPGARPGGLRCGEAARLVSFSSVFINVSISKSWHQSVHRDWPADVRYVAAEDGARIAERKRTYRGGIWERPAVIGPGTGGGGGVAGVLCPPTYGPEGRRPSNFGPSMSLILFLFVFARELGSL